METILKKFDFCCGAKRLWTPMNWGDLIKEIYPIEHIRRILRAISFCPYSVNRSSDHNIRAYYNFSYIGNFGAIKRSIFDLVGGFDESFIGWGSQDTDLMMRLCYKEFSHHILADDGIKVYHLSHPVNKETYKQQNRNLLKLKMQNLGIDFNSGNFFGDFLPSSNDFDII